MNFNQLSAVFLLSAAIFSCKNPSSQVVNPPQPPQPPQPQPAIVEEAPKEKKDPCRAEEWVYADLKLTLNEQEKACDVQKIVFKSQIATTNAKGAVEATAELAKLALDRINFSQIKCNNQSFNGMLLGVIDNNGKEDTLLEYTFAGGRLTGKAFLRTDDGKLHTFDFTPKREPRNVVEPMPNRDGVKKKPVVYLYPTQETSVNVRVNLKGELTHTYPKYNPAQGWTVTAKPDGELRDEKTGKIYYNLFWEGKSAHQYDLSTGFVVKGEDVADFLDESLAKLGLNRREANEFITYWLPEMEQNKYNLVHFSTSEYVAQAPLEITPKIDTEIRVFMVYQPLDAPINIAPQTLESPARKGFTLVEWGGMKQKRAEN